MQIPQVHLILFYSVFHSTASRNGGKTDFRVFLSMHHLNKHCEILVSLATPKIGKCTIKDEMECKYGQRRLEVVRGILDITSRCILSAPFLRKFSLPAKY